jgi:hypothetical protein
MFVQSQADVRDTNRNTTRITQCYLNGWFGETVGPCYLTLHDRRFDYDVVALEPSAEHVYNNPE